MLRTLQRALLLASLCLSLGCVSSPTSSDDGVALESTLMLFHKELRWSRFEEASVYVNPTHRERFLGRYEEMGEDFHIVQLDIKKVTLGRDPASKLPTALVECEQQWYREPNMVVKTEIFMESWVRERQGWMMKERMRKDAWRRLKKQGKAPGAGASDEQSPPSQDEDPSAGDPPLAPEG